MSVLKYVQVCSHVTQIPKLFGVAGGGEAGDGHKISQCECKSDFGETRVILTDSLSRL